MFKTSTERYILDYARITEFFKHVDGSNPLNIAKHIEKITHGLLDMLEKIYFSKKKNEV